MTIVDTLKGTIVTVIQPCDKHVSFFVKHMRFHVYVIMYLS